MYNPSALRLAAYSDIKHKVHSEFGGSMGYARHSVCRICMAGGGGSQKKDGRQPKFPSNQQ